MKKPTESLRQEFIDNKDDKSYRHAYADESLNMTIATQIKVLREQRGWDQQELADHAKMKQSMISRYEDVNYSSWTISTLKRLAEAFDVIVDVRFRSFRDLVFDTCSFSRESLQVVEFTKDSFFHCLASGTKEYATLKDVATPVNGGEKTKSITPPSAYKLPDIDLPRGPIISAITAEQPYHSLSV